MFIYLFLEHGKRNSKMDYFATNFSLWEPLMNDEPSGQHIILVDSIH